MGAEKGAIIAVQAAISILILGAMVYLAVTEAAVPEWLVNLGLLIVGSWFAAGAVVSVQKRRIATRDLGTKLRQRDDGSWESVERD